MLDSNLPSLAILLRRIHGKAEQRNKYARWDLHRTYYFLNQRGIHNEAELARALEHFHVTLSPKEITFLYASFPSKTIPNGFDFIAFANALYPPAKPITNLYHSVVPQDDSIIKPQHTPPSTALPSNRPTTTSSLAGLSAAAASSTTATTTTTTTISTTISSLSTSLSLLNKRSVPLSRPSTARHSSYKSPSSSQEKSKSVDEKSNITTETKIHKVSEEKEPGTTIHEHLIRNITSPSASRPSSSKSKTGVSTRKTFPHAHAEATVRKV